jgi:hypothetical protein
MSPSFEREILAHLQDYLKGRIELDQFKDWLVSATWQVEPEMDPTAMSLAYEVQMACADYSSDLSTESELRETLSALLPQDQLALSRVGEHR